MNALAAFRRRVRLALDDPDLHGNLRSATAHTLAKRERLLADYPDLETQRDAVAAARDMSADEREALLTQAAARLEEAGFIVHHAEDAAAARAIVLEILERAGARLVVKGKSMISEEIDLNEALGEAEIEVVETDLGEFIVQRLGQRPSHITAPALHLNRRQIGRLFEDELDAPPTEDPAELTALAREHLRERFLSADAGITGGNFVVAETGSLVLIENEGNIGLSTSLPPLHIAITGIEKVLPRLADLDPVFRLLPPSTTGQRAGSYLSIINGPAPAGDGPTTRHLIFLDNGRRALAASPEAGILACLRCGACLNICPCFRHGGGHAYGGIYPGPMGILLAPYLGADGPPPPAGESAHRPAVSLADVCSLCGACGEICPARIPLPDLIRDARGEKERRAGARRRLAWRAFSAACARPARFRRLGAFARGMLRALPSPLMRALTPAWSRGRALPPPPPRDFHQELARRHPERVR